MLRYINLLFFAGMVLMNYLANALPLNNRTTGELSDSYPNLFVPAGITFSIWGVIYLLIAIYCVIQFMPRSEGLTTGIGWLFTVSCVLNALWIVTWHYQKLPLSLLVMLSLLVVLIYINIGIKDMPYGIIKATFGIYLGWICIATIANVTALLVNYNFSGFGISPQVWTIVMIAIGTLIVALTLLRLDNPFIGLAVIWAFTGIIIKRSGDYRLIAAAALVGILVVGVFTVRSFIKA